ncbi:MAG: signal peptidase I [Elusimicrobiota bacterium]
METRLFWIGVSMGLYAWLSRRWGKSQRLNTRGGAAAWHALFLGMAGFAAVLILVLSLETRIQAKSLSPGGHRDLIYACAGALVLGAFGFWRGWRTSAQTEKRKHCLAEDLEWADTVFSAVLLASVLMYFVVQAFKIPSKSMLDTLAVGDHLFVNKFIYGVRIPLTDKRVLPLRKVRRGDIIVFRFPTEDPNELHCNGSQYKKDFIKRVIGLPGERVELRDGIVYADGVRIEPQYGHMEPLLARLAAPRERISPEQYQSIWEGRELEARLGNMMRDNFGPVTVPAKSYFVLGDNRDESCDGRFWGPVPEPYLKGKAWVRYWPPNRMGGIR